MSKGIQEGGQAIQEEVGLYQKGNQDELSAGKVSLEVLNSPICNFEARN